MDKNIKLFPFEYAGHGFRYDEGFYQNFDEMVIDCTKYIQDNVADQPYAILGYSMGSLVAYEVYYRLMQCGMHQPIHMFFLAHNPPIYKANVPSFENLSMKQFASRLTELGGTPSEILESEELLQIIYPKLKADFQLYSSYRYQPKADLINANISVLYSWDDNRQKKMGEWSEYTNQYCRLIEMPGNHFFIIEYLQETCKYISESLALQLIGC